MPTIEEIEELAKQYGGEIIEETPDVESLAKQFGGEIVEPISQIPGPQRLSFLQRAAQPIARFGRFLGFEPVGAEIAKRITRAAPRLVLGKTAKELTPEQIRQITETGFTPRQVLGSAATLGLTLGTLGGAGAAGALPARVLKTAALGTGFAGARALEKGKTPTAGELAAGAGLGAGLTLAGAGVSAIGRYITENFPRRLIQSALGQPKKELLAGKDISRFVLENKRIGTLGQLTDNSIKSIEKLGNQIRINLESAPKTVRILKNSIIGDVAKRINREGGAIATSEVTDIINSLAPQVKGLLSRQSLNLVEANQLRQALDRTLGDRGFLVSQLPFNKSVLRTFDNILRERVKSLAPQGTRELFSSLAKEITLRDALLEKFAGQARNQVVSVLDLILAGGGFLGGGPAGAAGTFALKKGLQSAFFKTFTGVQLSQLRALQPLLKKLSTTERALILNLIGQGVQQPSQGQQP